MNKPPCPRDPDLAVAPPSPAALPRGACGRTSGLLSTVGLGLLVGCASHGSPSPESRRWTADGAFLGGVHFGHGRRVRFAVGLELRALHGRPVDLCDGPSRLAGGGVFRLTLVGLEPRWVLAGIFDRASRIVSTAAEAGLGVQHGPDGGAFAHLGLDGALGGLVNAKATYAVRRDLGLLAGVRLPGTLMLSCVTEGRPIRDERRAVCLPAVTFVPTDADAPMAAEAERWRRRAAAEWGSVPAFLWLARDLAALGAPAALQDAARVAAEEEVSHALLAARRAAALTGRPVWLPPWPAAPRPDAPSVERMVFESWVDGLVGEAAAADTLAAEAAVTAEPHLRRALGRVARELPFLQT